MQQPKSQQNMEYPSGIETAFPGFDRVYYARSPGEGVFVAALNVSLEQAFGLIRAEFVPPEPVSAAWVYGRRRPGDFIWTSFAAPIIVSDRVVRVFRENAVHGWTTYKVALSDRAGEPIEGYSGLAIKGRCGPMQPDRRQEIRKPGPVGNVITVYRGLFFDPLSWDGADIFVPEGTGLVLMMDTVVAALKFAAVTGVEFVRADLNESPVR